MKAERLICVDAHFLRHMETDNFKHYIYRQKGEFVARKDSRCINAAKIGVMQLVRSVNTGRLTSKLQLQNLKLVYKNKVEVAANGNNKIQPSYQKAV